MQGFGQPRAGAEAPYPERYQQPPPQPPPSGEYYPQRPRIKVNKRAIAAMVIFIVVLVILGFTLVLPWYFFHIDLNGEISYTQYGRTINGDFEATLDLEMHFDESKNKMDMEMSATGETYSESQTTSSDYNDDDEVKKSLDIVFYLTIISIIFLIISIIVAVGAGFGLFNIKIGTVMAVIAMVLMIIIVIYFPIGFPQAVKKDLDESNASVQEIDTDINYDGSFFGSSTSSIDMRDFMPDTEGFDEAPTDLKTTWGPSDGWYLSIVGFIFVFIGLILIVLAQIGQILYHKPPQRGFEQRTVYKSQYQYQEPATQQLQPPTPSYGQQPPPQQYSCPNCGQPLTYEQLYQKWYCNSCDRYL